MSSATLAKTPLAPPGESAGSASNAFVINLVSSTTPVALIRPDHAGLRRFNFFVSRRREEGRERFRLHMGYFDTQEQAEQLLDIVRSIYPGAWAGLAPGRRLAAAAAAMAATPAPVASAVPVASVAPVPTTATVAATAPKAAARVTAEGAPSALALVPDEGRRPLADVEDVPEAQPRAAVSRAAPPRAETTQGAAQRAARNSLSNIRAAIASLEDSGIRSPLLDALPELQPAVIPVAQPVAAAPAVRTARPARPAEPVDPTSTLSDTGTLRLLETGIARPSSPATAGTATAAPRPVAAQKGATAAAAPAPREAPREEKPCFAVQLVWSVQPIEMAQVPQLAIFSAYTLYGAEGNRDGRRWYGLRLGFFTDAVSAKQVAQYVRADFATVSVVPVSSRERGEALKATGVVSAVPNAVGSGKDAATGKTGGDAKQSASDTVRSVRAVASATKPRATAKAGSRHPEFAFIEGTEPLASKAGAPSQALAKPGAAGSRMIGGRPTRGAPGKRAKVRKPGQIDARTVVKPKTLEETLEILGANQLQVDDEQGASINDSGVGHMRLPSGKARPSKLSRLIGRLSERMGS